jgi:hypothetical protein
MITVLLIATSICATVILACICMWLIAVHWNTWPMGDLAMLIISLIISILILILFCVYEGVRSHRVVILQQGAATGASSTHCYFCLEPLRCWNSITPCSNGHRVHGHCQRSAERHPNYNYLCGVCRAPLSLPSSIYPTILQRPQMEEWINRVEELYAESRV